MFLVPQHTRDTMGFPVDNDSIRSPTSPTEHPVQFHVQQFAVQQPLPPAISAEYQEIPLSAPTPRKTVVNQDSLERLVRSNMTTPEPSHQLPNLSRNSGAAAKVLSQEFPRESPVLGNRHTVRMYQPSQLGLGRNESVRTVDSLAARMVSDEELERLGVGIGGRI
jgi:hypothetical protein